MNKIIEFLSVNKLENADFLAILQRGTGEVLHFSQQGILVHDKKSKINFMSANDINTAKQMLELIPHSNMITAHESFYIPLIEEKFNTSVQLEVYQAAYFKTEPLPILADTIQIKRLERSYIDFIHENYKQVDDRDYIAERIEDGMYGAFVNGQMAGFIGHHDEGSIGLLFVFPQYRRKNIGYSLTAFMVNEALENNEITYSQITTSNTVSYAFHKKLGFEITGKIYWLF